jgi:hypothetical protein
MCCVHAHTQVLTNETNVADPPYFGQNFEFAWVIPVNARWIIRVDPRVKL